VLAALAPLENSDFAFIVEYSFMRSRQGTLRALWDGL
jgi:hypothetical protein